MRRRFRSILNRTIIVCRASDLSVFSGYATLYILLSLVPLLMLATGIINLLPFFDLEDFSELLVKLLPNLDQIRDLIMQLLRNMNSQSAKVVLSVSGILLLYSTTRGVFALRRGLSAVYGIRHPKKNLITAGIFTLSFIILIPALLIFQLLGDIIREQLGALLPDFLIRITSVMRISRIITLGMTVVFVLLIYTFLCGKTRNPLSQLPGAVFTIAASGLFSFGFTFFIPRFWNAASYYGPLASVFLVIMWLRTLINILFIGAALNCALEQLRDEKQQIDAADESV